MRACVKQHQGIFFMMTQGYRWRTEGEEFSGRPVGVMRDWWIRCNQEGVVNCILSPGSFHTDGPFFFFFLSSGYYGRCCERIQLYVFVLWIRDQAAAEGGADER